MLLEKTLENSLDNKEIIPLNSKGMKPEHSLEEMMLKLKLQYFVYLMGRAESWEMILMLGKTEGKRKRGQQRMRKLDGITDSMDMNLSKFWKIVKGRQGWHAEVHKVTVRHDLVTEQQHKIFKAFHSK